MNFAEQLATIALENYKPQKYRTVDNYDDTEQTYAFLKDFLLLQSKVNGGGIYLVFRKRDPGKFNYHTDQIIQSLINDGLSVKCLHNVEQYIEYYEVTWHSEIPPDDKLYIVRNDGVKLVSQTQKIEILEALILRNYNLIEEMREYTTELSDDKEI